ncbi:MAG: two-component system, sensor histidine kinase and response regulator [Actinomycetota bacterium]|nr:two-component system, sensor histidine kinase and response regulator [Actinomycetota bacterium]
MGPSEDTEVEVVSQAQGPPASWSKPNAAAGRRFLPTGGALPEDAWRSRHRGILCLLVLHVPALFVFAVARGYGWRHGLVEVLPIAGLAVCAYRSISRRATSTICASLGLMTASAVLVHLSGGMIEAHFHFFVMVGVIALYQDWRPFLAAIGFVLLHHGIIGVLAPHDVYDHASAQQHPWVWAGVHSGFIVAMSAAGVANWKLNERSQSQLAGLAAIVESSDDAIYGWTTHGLISSWNRGAVELFGYRPDEIIGQPVTVLVPPPLLEETYARFDHSLHGRSVEPLDTQRLRKDGTFVEVSVRISCLRDSLGEVVGGATIIRDMTARRRSEDALKRNKVELQQTLSLVAATLEATADGIFVSNLEGEAVDFNTPFADLWHLPDEFRAVPDMAKGMAHAIELLEDPEAFVASSGEIFGHPDGEFHDTLYFTDGSIYERSSRPQRVDGVIVGRVWNFHDITERRQLEAELAEARDEALASSRLKSDFLATMSHEIRTPMNGVIGLTGLLLDSSLTDIQRQYANGVRTSGEALLGIINDILDFSKIEAGKLDLETVDFDLTEALDDVAFLVAESARAKGLELVAYCHPGMPVLLRGDVGRLRQILLNLVGNAVKFTAEGEVVLRASQGRCENPDKVMVRLEVLDTGIGIARATSGRLFEAFSQADASTTRRYGGTGLGLAISRRLAEAMGGNLGVDSDLGHGSVFWVELPLDRATEANPVKELSRRLPPGLRILIVDDNQTNRLVLGSQLLAWDLAADLVPDAFVALDVLRQAAKEGHPYDLALVDMAMPGMDGMELARIVSADPALRSIRLLLLSSLSVGPEEAARAGFSVSLTKPARLSHLYEALVRTMAPPTEVAPLKVPVAPATDSGTKGRLLIVEDNAINQAVARAMVAKMGYSCDVAGNGIEALSASDRRHYDAVLMDCQMPEMDGFEATAEIRRREVGGTPVPIIAMTAGALAEDRDRCLASGMDDYLSKPVKSSELERMLARWLPCPDDLRDGQPR